MPTELPTHPNIQYLKKQAKVLPRDFHYGKPHAIEKFTALRLQAPQSVEGVPHPGRSLDSRGFGPVAYGSGIFTYTSGLRYVRLFQRDLLKKKALAYSAGKLFSSFSGLHRTLNY